MRSGDMSFIGKRKKPQIISTVTMIINLSIVNDVPREKAYHLKPKLLGKVSMRPAYRSSKKVLVNDKLEAEVKKNRKMISLKETLL
ncbi:hypothetical protein YC2023_023982 [Brassica napus]